MKSGKQIEAHGDQLLLYRRGRNRWATRNHVGVFPSVFCTNETVRKIVEPFKDRKFGEFQENRVIGITHETGCCSVGIDEPLSLRMLQNTTLNPNVGRALSVSLGCGSFCSQSRVAGCSNKNGKLIVSITGAGHKEEVVLQGEGGRDRAVARGREIVGHLIRELENESRHEAPISALFSGVLNGSSDATSGLFSNPAVGHICDEIIKAGGRVAFGQTTETLGAEFYLTDKIDSERVCNKLTKLLAAVTMMRLAVERDGVECEPTQGNIRAGISSLSEKSLGTVLKIGSDSGSKIVDVLPPGKSASTTSGIHFTHTPGQDVLAMSGLVAAGVNLLIFTTGRGAPTGAPFVPTVKVTANRQTFENMPDIIDFYLPVEKIFDEGASLSEIALEFFFPYLLDVVSGRRITSSENATLRDFQVLQLWPRE